MRKTILAIGRIVVEPIDPGDKWILVRKAGETKEQALVRHTNDLLEQITKDIKRHVNDVAHVYVEGTVEPVCSHCGWEWTEESNSYNGGCCDADEAGKEADHAM